MSGVRKVSETPSVNATKMALSWQFYLWQQYEDLCRFCLSQIDLLPIFVEQGEINKRLEKALDVLLRMVDDKDGLPNRICHGCLDVIEHYVDFKSGCIPAYRVLNDVRQMMTSREREQTQEVVVEETVDEPVPTTEEESEEMTTMTTSTTKEDTIACDEMVEVDIRNVGNEEEIEAVIDDTVECDTVECDTVECDALECDALECDALEVAIEETNEVIEMSVELTMEEYERHIRLASEAKPEGWGTRKDRRVPIVSCTICHKQYQGRNTLRKHLRIHFQIKNYKCKHCHRSYSDRSSLRVHESRHGPTKEQLCSSCGKSYFNASELHQHQIMQHLERKFLCDLCQKLFPSKTILQDHMLVHTSERPYSCKICMSGFKRERNLISHMRTHEVRILPAKHGIDLIKCPSCELLYPYPADLLAHMQEEHKAELEATDGGPYSCDHCTSTFATIKKQLEHESKHYILEVDDQYVCGNCNKVFKFKSLAHKHLLSHRNSRPFICLAKGCSKRYKHSSHLTRHMSHDHNPEDLEHVQA